MVGTRPDMAYAIGVLGKYCNTPTTLNLKVARKLVSHLHGTREASITYPRGSGKLDVCGYMDADWGGDKVDRRSTTGYVFTVNGMPVSWSSKRQPTIVLSSTEAEYMAATQATKEAIWLRRLLKDLGHEEEGPTVLMEDNQGCIALSKNPIHHSRTKHIDIQWHFIREKVETGEVVLKYIPIDEQVVDLLTKALDKKRHLDLVVKIGMSLGPST